MIHLGSSIAYAASQAASAANSNDEKNNSQLGFEEIDDDALYSSSIAKLHKAKQDENIYKLSGSSYNSNTVLNANSQDALPCFIDLYVCCVQVDSIYN